MRGKKSYNIRNIEAHILPQINTKSSANEDNNTTPSFLLNRNMVFQNNTTNNNITTTNNNITTSNSTLLTNHQTQINEYINAKYGVSKYASNLVSGKMFKNI
jgi:hypothetical protein